jgi:hypothetical protein
MSEINSIQRTKFDFDLQTSVGLDVPIIAGTSHFFETSSPWPGITGMQFPVNNIPRQQRVLLPENSSPLTLPFCPPWSITLCLSSCVFAALKRGSSFLYFLIRERFCSLRLHLLTIPLNNGDREVINLGHSSVLSFITIHLKKGEKKIFLFTFDVHINYSHLYSALI